MNPLLMDCLVCLVRIANIRRVIQIRFLRIHFESSSVLIFCESTVEHSQINKPAGSIIRHSFPSNWSVSFVSQLYSSCRNFDLSTHSTQQSAWVFPLHLEISSTNPRQGWLWHVSDAGQCDKDPLLGTDEVNANVGIESWSNLLPPFGYCHMWFIFYFILVLYCFLFDCFVLCLQLLRALHTYLS